MSGDGMKRLRGIRLSASKKYGAGWNLSCEEGSMKDDEYSEDWLVVDVVAEVIRADEHDSKLNPLDAQMRLDYGVAFMELGTGLEGHAIEACKAAARLRPSWSAVHFQLGLAYAAANRREEAVES